MGLPYCSNLIKFKFVNSNPVNSEVCFLQASSHNPGFKEQARRYLGVDLGFTKRLAFMVADPAHGVDRLFHCVTLEVLPL